MAELTTRQREVLSLVSQGRTNREISQVLAITVATVKTHLYRACRKTGVHNRVKLALRFAGLGGGDGGGEEAQPAGWGRGS